MPASRRIIFAAILLLAVAGIAAVLFRFAPGSRAALPIWMDVMKAYIEEHGDRKMPPQFEAPGNIVFVTLDSGITEAFINGTQPQAAAPAVTPASTPPVPGTPAAPPVAAPAVATVPAKTN